jgi:hypothetical protein
VPPAYSRPLPTFRLDVQYTQLAAQLASQGLSPILLKGPAFDQLLFDGARKRAYSDIDVLIDPGQANEAERLMEECGFHRAEASPAARLGWRAGVAVGLLDRAHATAWVRDRDRFTIDLHHTLPLVHATANEVWSALAAHRTAITLVDSPATTLDRTASALLIALHAAHHGPSWSRARTDLQRACELLERDCWRAAAQLARDLKAETAMGVGLGTTPEGAALAHDLGLRTRPTLACRLIWSVTASIDRRRTEPVGL